MNFLENIICYRLCSIEDICLDILNKLVNFLKDPFLGFPLCRKLFGLFKQEMVQSDIILEEEEEFIKQSLDRLELEVVDGETSKGGIYMEVSSFLVFL